VSYARWYDLLHVGPASPTMVAWFASLVPDGGRVLEVGAGTGRVSGALAARAASLTCLEPSAEMRAILRDNLAGLPVTVLPDAMPGFVAPQAFEYAVLATVLAEIPHTDRRAVFAAIADSLTPGGMVATDMVDDEPVPDRPERKVRSAVRGGVEYTRWTAIRPVGRDVAAVRHVYRRYVGGALVERSAVELRHWFHRPKDVLADLAAVGLEPVGGSALTGGDDRGTLVARKPGDRSR